MEKLIETVKYKSYAKINLALKVVGKREDGYHLLQMINDEINIFDKLMFKKLDKRGIVISCNKKELEEENIVEKIAKHMFDVFALQGGLEIKIEKRIPVGAGLGGGSSNGATAIKAINEIYHLNLRKDQMIAIGEKFGADVPYFIYGGAAIVEGIGEIIKPFTYTPKFSLIVVKPVVSCDTKKVFKEYQFEESDYDLMDFKSALELAKNENISHFLFNSLEEIACRMYDEIRQTKQLLKHFGFDGVFMTGSGSCVVAISSKSKKELIAISDEIKKNSFVEEAIVTSIRRGDI